MLSLSDSASQPVDQQTSRSEVKEIPRESRKPLSHFFIGRPRAATISSPVRSDRVRCFVSLSLRAFSCYSQLTRPLTIVDTYSIRSRPVIN